MEQEGEFLERILILRIIAIVCFFIAAVSVLESFIWLSSYWAYAADQLKPNVNEEWVKVFQKIEEEPYLFLGLNIYNIILWNGVIIGSIGAIRCSETARKTLRTLLGIDMIVTVVHLLWDAFSNPETMQHPGWFILINAMQVAAIIALSHPKIIELTESRSMSCQKSVSTTNHHNTR